MHRKGHAGHLVSVVTFDTECRVVVRLAAGDTALQSAAMQLRHLNPEGKETALLDAVAHCFDLLRGNPEHIKRLVILTDGADTISVRYVGQYICWATYLL